VLRMVSVTGLATADSRDSSANGSGIQGLGRLTDIQHSGRCWPGCWIVWLVPGVAGWTGSFSFSCCRAGLRSRRRRRGCSKSRRSLRPGSRIGSAGSR
jgi:hypothetical protein